MHKRPVRLVLSSNRFHYEEFIKLFDLNRNDTRLITNADCIRGWPRGTTVFCINTYTDHKHYAKINQYMREREMRPVEVHFNV
jgi:hypothetical protein